jgi:hypothetical protein
MINKLGYPIVGATNQNPFSQGASCRFTTPLDVFAFRVSKGVVYIQSTSCSATFAIYSDDGGGNPQNLLAYSGTRAITAPGWYSFTDLIEYSPGGLYITPGITYHLAVWLSSSSGNFLNVDSGSTNQFSELNNPGTFPSWAPSVTPLSQSNLNLSIYLEYYNLDARLGYPSIGEIYTPTYTAPGEIGCLFQAPANSLFDNLQVRMRTATTPGRINVALYSDNSGTPKNLLCTSGGSYATVSTTEKWYSCPMRGYIVSGLSYWLVVSCNQNFIMNFDSGFTNQSFDASVPYATWNTAYNLGSIGSYGARSMSFYLQNSSLVFDSGDQFVNFNGRIYNSDGDLNLLNKPEVRRVTVNGVSNTVTLPTGTSSCVYLVSSTNTTSYNLISIILPTTNSYTDVVGIKKLSGTFSPINIQPVGFTIDGQASVTIYDQYEEITLVTDGGNWFII